MSENKGCQMWQSEDGKARLYCENDMALGALHDFLMERKGDITERMVQAQKAQEEEAAKVMKKEEAPSTEAEEVKE